MFNTVCCDNDLYTPYTVLIVNYNRPREMKYARRLLSTLHTVGWWRGSVVERRSLAGELSLSCARPAADG